jgi:RHS repeat-associated protein
MTDNESATPRETFSGRHVVAERLPRFIDYRSRHYDAETGSFLRSDGILFTHDHNDYSYADGNPVTRVDPDGHLSFDISYKCRRACSGQGRAAIRDVVFGKINVTMAVWLNSLRSSGLVAAFTNRETNMTQFYDFASLGDPYRIAVNCVCGGNLCGHSNVTTKETTLFCADLFSERCGGVASTLFHEVLHHAINEDDGSEYHGVGVSGYGNADEYIASLGEYFTTGVNRHGGSYSYAIMIR